jgi:hypothetical protein
MTLSGHARSQARRKLLTGPLRSFLVASARREATWSGIVGYSRFPDADEVGTLAAHAGP